MVLFCTTLLYTTVLFFSTAEDLRIEGAACGRDSKAFLDNLVIVSKTHK